MKAILAALLLFPIVGFGKPVSLEPAGIVLEVPDDWRPLDKDAWPDAPGNVCFPRFDHKTRRGRIDAVIWRKNQSLDEALNRYIRRILVPGGELSHKKISRGSFHTDSGVEGIKYVFEATRQSACGPDTWKLVRFIFRNGRGEIVCLGGYGDIEEVERIVLSSLQIEK